MEPTSFESSFSNTAWKDWFGENNSIAYIMSAVYVVGIFWGQNQMRHRKAYNLKRPLLLWNLFLGIFSLVGAIRSLPEMIGYFQLEEPWHTSICTNNHRSRTHKFWFLLFVLSKALELVDTIFIILRKRPLLFLHWYHHMSMVMITWTSYAAENSTSGWYMALNYTVHSIMYSYYALRGLNLKIPQIISMLITSLQIIQMFLGFGTSLFAMIAKLQGYPCETETSNILASLFVSGSYAVLFVHFFMNTYSKTKTI